MTHQCCSAPWIPPFAGIRPRAIRWRIEAHMSVRKRSVTCVFGRLLAAIDNFTAVPDTYIDAGDYVVTLGRYGGAMKAGGAKLDAQFCHVFRFAGGKIATFQQYTDTTQWARLMG